MSKLIYQGIIQEILIIKKSKLTAGTDVMIFKIFLPKKW
jgi:hypothetical protein